MWRCGVLTFHFYFLFYHKRATFLLGYATAGRLALALELTYVGVGRG
jgi:hypothetical protein